MPRRHGRTSKRDNAVQHAVQELPDCSFRYVEVEGVLHLVRVSGWVLFDQRRSSRSVLRYRPPSEQNAAASGVSKDAVVERRIDPLTRRVVWSLFKRQKRTAERRNADRLALPNPARRNRDREQTRATAEVQYMTLREAWFDFPLRKDLRDDAE